MSESRFPHCRVHPTALIEEDVILGPGCAVWDNAHIRHGARLGRECIVGEKSTIAYDVRIGDFVKMNSAVYVCAGVRIESHVMISAHTVFTNDLFPRAFDRTLDGLAPSEPTDETLETLVERGVTLGANATIGPGLRLGAFAMIGMGSVVTRDVPAHGLVLGNPARLVGWVCACGPSLARLADLPTSEPLRCDRCGRVYRAEPEGLMLLEGPPETPPVPPGE